MQRTALAALAASLLSLAAAAHADDIVINNVRIFNGVDERLSSGSLKIEDGVITEISSRSISAPDGGTVIDGGNRILSPGFIDLHAHVTLQYPIEQARSHPTVAGAVAAEVMRFYLDSGFTTIRDAGATHPDLARSVEAGTIVGPRIYPSGAIISQTSGHGDQRVKGMPHPTLAGVRGSLNGGEYMLADGVDQTLMSVRENLKNGATQIKIMGGGGVMSTFDPIHTLQATPDEIQAAVQAASDWGTYVLAHAYTAEAIHRLVSNGVRCIEHGLLIDDATAKFVADNDAVISTQLMTYRTLQELDGISDTNLAKLELVLAGQETLIELIKKYDITTGFGTDFVFGGYVMLGEEFTARAEYWSPHEVMVQATSESAKVIRMAGKLNRHGNFGEIREGWSGDVVVINGDPFDDISILETPETSIAVIVSNGKVHKNTL